MKNKLYYILVVLICTVGFAQRGVYTSFNSGELSPELHGRIDALKFYSGCRILENFFVWSQGPVEKRRGTYFIAEVGGEIFPAVPAIPGAAATYRITFISENGAIWGIPLNYPTYTTLTLDAGGAATDIGDGIVGLPCAGNPFIEGQVIRIEGTTNYDGEQTLTSGATASELQFTDSFVTESFDGTETVVQYISLSASANRMDQDDNNIRYFGHNIISSNCITKVSQDGMTIDTSFFTPGTAFAGTTCLGIKVSTNSEYLYAYTDGRQLYKFDLSDGSEVWMVSTGTSPGYDIDIDESDNVYVCKQGTSYTLSKFAAADGTETDMTDMGGATGTEGGFDVHVDNDMDVVLVGGYDYKIGNDTGLYNLAIRTLDNSDGAQTALGGTYEAAPLWMTYTIGTQCIKTYGSYIYVLCNDIVYKLDSELNTIAQVNAPTYNSGLFIDLRGNIVVINQRGTQNDVFWFYDTGLNYLTKIDGFYTTMLNTWNNYTWMKGNVVFDGALEIPGTPAVPAVEAFSNGLADVPPARLLSFDYPKEDSYVIEAGAGYMRFYKDVP